MQLTARKATTNIGVIHDPGHAEPWIIAMPSAPGYLRTLDYSARWAIEPMFSDFKSRGFGVEDTQIQHPDRLARLLLVMALALYVAVSTGRHNAETNSAPAEKKDLKRQPKKVARSKTSFFTRGLRRIAVRGPKPRAVYGKLASTRRITAIESLDFRHSAMAR